MQLDPMKLAIEEAKTGIALKHGGPFGAVVIRDGVIIGRGHNRVLVSNNPTAHGEVEAIRDACKTNGSHDLSGCVLYTTCYPCPMCLGAILWARIEKVYFCLSTEKAKDLGFDDSLFYEMFNDEKALKQLLVHDDNDQSECETLFEEYANSQPELY